MYNLLVSANAQAWEGHPYELELGRVLCEFTSDTLTARYADLSDAALAVITGSPALFAYENGNQQPARIGWITRVRHRSRLVRIEYEIEWVLAPIPPARLLELQWDLDLTDWEMNRTHWALKDVDLFPILLEAGLIDAAVVHAQPPDSRIATFGLAQRPPEIEARPTVFRLPTTPQEQDLVSVMMPFNAAFDQVFQTIVGACAAAGLRCHRADNIWEEDEVIQDVFSLIYRSAIVVCDFTGQNANVFYEAGIAHTLGRPVVPIAQHQNDVPFDLRHHRFIHYLNNTEGRASLAQAITRRLTTLRRS